MKQAMLNNDRPQDFSPEMSYVSNTIHPYHRSLPHGVNSGIDGENFKTKSMPRSVNKHRPRHHPKHTSRLPSNHLPDNPNRYEDLFDRTLERMTSHINGDAGIKPVKIAKRTDPHHLGASLSTRSPSPMYSSQDINSHVLSDTDELRTESDCMSPPP